MGLSTTKREVIEIDDDDDEDDKVNQEVMDVDAAKPVNTDIDPSSEWSASLCPLDHP